MHISHCKHGSLRPPRLSQLVSNVVAKGQWRGIDSLSMTAVPTEGATSVEVSSSSALLQCR